MIPTNVEIVGTRPPIHYYFHATELNNSYLILPPHVPRLVRLFFCYFCMIVLINLSDGNVSSPRFVKGRGCHLNLAHGFAIICFLTTVGAFVKLQGGHRI